MTKSKIDPYYRYQHESQLSKNAEPMPILKMNWMNLLLTQESLVITIWPLT
jgi:hypothetical protein